jgi:hypothetical protein
MCASRCFDVHRLGLEMCASRCFNVQLTHSVRLDSRRIFPFTSLKYFITPLWAVEIQCITRTLMHGLQMQYSMRRGLDNERSKRNAHKRRGRMIWKESRNCLAPCPRSLCSTREADTHLPP